MENNEIPSTEERLPIPSSDAMEEAIREVEQQEQLYSIALFDILGFSNLVQNNGTQIVLDLYNKLLDIIHKMRAIPAMELLRAALSLCPFLKIGKTIS